MCECLVYVCEDCGSEHKRKDLIIKEGIDYNHGQKVATTEWDCSVCGEAQYDNYPKNSEVSR